jgi:hypothetical protein
MTRWQYWLTNLLAVLCVGTAGYAWFIQGRFAALDREVSQRNELIQRGVELSRLNTGFIQAIAEEAAASGDRELAKLLADQGIKFTVAGAAAGGDDGDQ